MEIATSYLGEKNEVWIAVGGFAKGRAILSEEGREETTNSIRYLLAVLNPCHSYRGIS